MQDLLLLRQSCSEIEFHPIIDAIQGVVLENQFKIVRQK
ncbi:unnamed protein product [Paramecium octaurelia]|uniref:Uncharacterized protein n=1 Tax=Paramecium octaurelia TaxID=43137 RepID=A0A8S1VM86_PAROT|nr:unnamed protein product [Paramecium octaurelia]